MPKSFAAPNQHFLGRLVNLSECQTITAGRDIYDDHGFKLWAKGVPVSRELQTKLLLRKLAKPLESSLSVEHAVSFAEIIDDCLRKLDEEPLLDKMSGTHLCINAETLLNTITKSMRATGAPDGAMCRVLYLALG